MPAKPLTPSQIADAARLRAFFKAWQADRKAKKLPHAQAEIAEPLFGFGQSALSQYLNGHIPMNADVVMKFAEVLDVPPTAINPTVVRQEQERAQVWARPPGPTALLALSPLALDAAIQLNDIADPAMQRKAYALFVRALERAGLTPGAPTAAPVTAPVPAPAPAPAPSRKRVTSR